MPRRKKKAEEEQPIVEQPVEEQIVEEPIVDRTAEEVQPTEVLIGTFCSQGYDFEMPTIRSLTVDSKTLGLMLSGAFRPFQKYDRVVFKADDKKHFALFLAFRAVVPGGVIVVSPELAGLRMFSGCPQAAEGEMVRVTKK
jgi:hypothetical protein